MKARLYTLQIPTMDRIRIFLLTLQYLIELDRVT